MNYNFFEGGGIRQSGMEALRIVAMSMILIHHFLCHGLKCEIPHNLYSLIDPIVYSGVDIFFLISGHFLIKLSKKGVVKFASSILFFTLVNIGLNFACGEHIGILDFITLFMFPISRNPYWFIHVYFVMMITAPIINAGLKALSKQQLIYVVFTLTFLATYMRGGLFSYTYLNGLTFYCIGYALRTLNVASYFTKHTLLIFSCAILLSSGFINYCVRTHGVSRLTPFMDFSLYSNPFILLSAVSLYLYFSKLEFKSRVVNGIAAASLGCYLLQDGRFGNSFFYNFQHSYMLTHGYGIELFAMFVVSFIGFWVASFLLTKFKNIWINQVGDILVALCDKVISIRPGRAKV